MRDWKDEWDFEPRLVMNDLPEAVQGELVKFTKELVEAAQARQAAIHGNDRRKL